jgi:elongation factor G
MDRERADFSKALESIKTRIQKVTPIFLPIGAEESFKGVVDLVAMKAYLFEGPKGGYKTVDIPADLKDEAESLRETMMEDIAESDENLMEKYLEDGEISVKT